MKKNIALGLLLLYVFTFSAASAITQSDYDAVVAQRNALYQQLISLGIQPCIEIEDLSSEPAITGSTEGEEDAAAPKQEMSVHVETADRTISILTEEMTVSVGRQFQVKAEVIRNSEDAPAKSVLQWSTRNEELVKISPKGVVTGIAPGEAIIQCQLADNPDIKELASIHVVQPVKSIKAENRQITLLYGASQKAAQGTIEVVISPENATNQNCLYSSSDESVVTVDDQGHLQAVSPGKASITVLPADGSKGVRAVCYVTVGQAVSSISIPVSQKTMDKKTTFRLEPKILPENASVKKLEYSSSDPEVARVSSNGTITAVQCGKATITARAADGTGVSAQCSITVVQKVKSVQLDKRNITLEYEKTGTLKATVLPEDATNQKLMWSSSDWDIVRVDRDGTIRGIKPGTATVTCQAKDGSGVKATATVKVTYKAKTKNGAVSNGVPIGNPSELEFETESRMRSGTISIRSVTVQKLNNDFFRFTMKYKSPAGYSIHVFSPPNGEYFDFDIKNRTSSGAETVQFEIHKKDLIASEFVTIQFYRHDGSGNTFYVFPEIDTRALDKIGATASSGTSGRNVTSSNDSQTGSDEIRFFEFKSKMMNSVSSQINEATDLTATASNRAVLAALLTLEYQAQCPDRVIDYSKPLLVAKSGTMATVVFAVQGDYVMVIFQMHPLSTSYGYLGDDNSAMAKAALEMISENVWTVPLNEYNAKLKLLIQQIQ